MWLKSILTRIYNKVDRLSLLCSSIFLGLYVFFVLWITLFSRGEEERVIYLIPLYSWNKVLSGDFNWLVENLGNIIIFMPFGFFLTVLQNRKNRTIVGGILLSLFIEIVQLINNLGCFEIDDLIHNTLGTLLGILICQKLWHREISKSLSKKIYLGITAATLMLCITITFSLKAINQYSMVKFAEINNINGEKNLLVLDGKDGFTWNGEVYVKYLSDGSISIKGKSASVSWFPIGKLRLDKGEYIFLGLSGVDNKTVALEIEYKNSDGQYVRLTDDVGPNAQVEFTVENVIDIKIYVIVYPGCDCDVIARPVIYRLGE